MIDISVIIPVHNKEQYLKRTLDSMLRQNYSAFEVICIDDGSTDTSLSILLEYEKKDQRIHVVHQENKGVSEARNRGISLAKGEYILFLDSDDELEDGALEALMEHRGKDIILAGYTHVGKYRDKTTFFDKEDLKGDEIADYIANMKDVQFFYFMCSKMYKREIIQKNNLQFNKHSFGEDSHFNFQYIKFIESAVIVDQSVYRIHMTPDSLSRKKHDEFIIIWEAMYEVYREALKLAPENEKYKNVLFVKSINTLIGLSFKTKISLKDFRKLCQEMTKNISEICLKRAPIGVNFYQKTMNRLTVFFLKSKHYRILYYLLKIRLCLTSFCKVLFGKNI